MAAAAVARISAVQQQTLRIYGTRENELLKILLLSFSIFISLEKGDLGREKTRQLQILSRCTRLLRGEKDAVSSLGSLLIEEMIAIFL